MSQDSHSTLGVRPAAPPEDLEDRRLRAALGARLFGRDETVAIDRFELRGKLGSGGMGVVYDAYDPKLRRRIALKVVRPDREDAREHRRLLREARAAARLKHPNLVTVYEVGQHDDMVWVAMEFIDGPTLSDWLSPGEASNSPRSWRAIVRLFIEAGEGLAEAHRNGIVHRDFKPANVLVERAGTDAPVPRVVDFGLALGTDPGKGLSASHVGFHSTGDRQETWADKVVGTPAYMAPEQMGSGDVDARADQFAFCVSLFEALEGHRPYEAATLAEVLMRIEDGDHARPRKPLPRWLVRAVLKGLEPRPDDRHASMEALVQTLRAGLERRPRWVIAAGALGVLGAVALALGLTSEDPCAAVDREAVEVWNEDARAQVRAWFDPEAGDFRKESMARFESRFESWIGRWRSMRIDTCRAAAIEGQQSATLRDRRDLCLDRQLNRARGLLGQTATAPGAEHEVARLTEAATALPDLSSCENTEVLLGEVAFPDDPDRRRNARDLDQSLAALEGVQRTEDPKILLARSEAVLERADEVGHPPLVARAHYIHARGLLGVGRRDEAYEGFMKAMRAAVSGSSSELAAEAALMGAWSRIEHYDDLEDAARLLDDADAFITASGDLPRHRGTWHDYAGVLAYAKGDLDGSVERHRTALALREAVPELHLPAAQSRINLAGVLALTDRTDEAFEQFSLARTELESQLGPRHPMVAKLLTNYGTALYTAGRTAEAIDALEQALAMKEAVFGPKHHFLATTLVNLSNARWDAGDVRGSIRDLERAIALRETELGEDHPRLAIPLLNLGEGYEEIGELDRAITTLERAEAILLAQFEAAHIDVVHTRTAIADVLARLGKLEQAREIYEEELAPVLGTTQASFSTRLDIQIEFARLLMRMGETDRAKEVIDVAAAQCAGAGEDCKRDPRAVLDAGPTAFAQAAKHEP